MCINVLFSVVILLLVCAITADIHQLHSTISRLQGIVASRCDLEGVCVSVCVCVLVLVLNYMTQYRPIHRGGWGFKRTPSPLFAPRASIEVTLPWAQPLYYILPRKCNTQTCYKHALTIKLSSWTYLINTFL